MQAPAIARLGLVVHPQREITSAMATLERWSEERGVDLVQVPAPGQNRDVARPGDAADCDVIVALGGDGTTLAALRAAAAVGRPVMGVACGSLGALTAVTAGELASALDRLAAGDWHARELPALALALGPETLTAVNDLVIVRDGASQVGADVYVDGELFVRFAGDGLVVATPLGSSAYTLASGGPLLAPPAGGMVLTPLAPHGGSCPPLVAAAAGRLTIGLDPGHGGARIELDGQIRDRVPPRDPRTLEITVRPAHATLVTLGGEESFLAGLRRRRVIIDSPRVLARDDRGGARCDADAVAP
jgi:NAD+ kinase